MKKLWILGAPDPEMQAIETLLRDVGVSGEEIVYAVTGRHGQLCGTKRVHPGNAYRASNAIEALARDPWWDVVLVECGIEEVIEMSVTVVDHHRVGDPGYGRLPLYFWEASSIGQVWEILRRDGKVSGMPRDTVEGRRHLMVAAADHCLAAAYRGECPGVDPEALMSWRAESRAAFQKRPVEEVLADVEKAREALRKAFPIAIAHTRESRPSSPLWVRDMMGQRIRELPEAAAREGIAFLATTRDREKREKVVLQAGSPEQIRAFMENWARTQGLVGIYGDPARGFAGGYIPQK